VVGDQLRLDPHAPERVSPILAIGLVAAAVASYLGAMGLIVVSVVGSTLPIARIWTGALLVLAAVVGAVAAGLPLAWALPLLALSPALVVVMVHHARPRPSPQGVA